MAQDLPSERILYQLLREWLSQREPDLWVAFERDPEATLPRLRAFLERAAAVLPPRLATYVSGGQVERLVNIAQAGVVYIRPAEARPALTPEQRQGLERDYLERVAEECRYLETEGVDRARAELTDVFVMLEAVESPSREAEADVAPVPERAVEMGLKERVAAALFGRREAGREERASPPSPVPLFQALGEHTHLIILGEPGTGKTTTLQFVALCFATDGWAKDRLQLDEARVPVRVALREYNGGERLDRFLIRWLDRAYVPQPLAQGWLAEGRLAVLLDGLDEVPEAHRAAVVEAIERFAGTSEGRRCRILVTSRIASYQEVRSLGADFGQYTIRPFAGPQDAQPYAAGWLRVLKPQAAADEAQALLETMKQQSGLRRVIGNPLLLRLAVALYVEIGELARSRAELYRRYVEEVAWKRAEAREQPRWSRREIEVALEAVAWELQTQGEQTAAALAGIVEGEVADMADGRELLDYLRERLGLLAVYGYERGDLVAFSHQTFQEYFAARRLKGAWDDDPERAWRFLRPRLHHPAWREPTLLLAGMLGKTEATDLVRRILRVCSPYERELHRDLLLAAVLLRDGVLVATDVAGRVADLLTQLSLDVRGWRIGGRLAALPRLQAVLALPQRSGGWCACALLREQVINGLARLPRPQRTQGVESLIQALGDEDGHVRRAAAGALQAIGDLQAVEPLIQALGDEDEDMPGTAAEVLTICYRLSLRSLIWALGDEAWYVDGAAAELLIRALGDEDEHVRGAAARALGKIGDPRAVEPLIRALGDEDGDVRRAVAEALGNIGDARAVEPLVQTLGDEDEHVRGAAAWALGKIGDPRAVEPLVRALGDRSEYMRLAAAEALGAISENVEDCRTAHRAARRLCWRLVDGSRDAANAVWKALARVVARLTELKVAALGAGPPLFTTTPVGARPSPALPIVLSILIAALSGLASNIVAAYLQDRYRLISNVGRFGLVVAVFVLTLVASIWLALRRGEGTAEAARRQ